MTDLSPELPDQRPPQPQPYPVQPYQAQPYQAQPHQVQPQYQAQYYQQGYVAYQPVYVVPPPRGLSITALVLGLVSIFFGFTFFVPLGALIFGIIGLRREPAGRGMAITGIVIGGVFMLFWLALGGFFLSLMLASLSALTSIPTY